MIIALICSNVIETSIACLTMIFKAQEQLSPLASSMLGDWRKVIRKMRDSFFLAQVLLASALLIRLSTCWSRRMASIVTQRVANFILSTRKVWWQAIVADVHWLHTNCRLLTATLTSKQLAN